MNNPTIKQLKTILKEKYNITIKTTPLQKGCVAIQHSEEETIKVRYLAKSLGFERMTNEKYKTIYGSSTKATTIIY
jgi:hypothetical protein